MLSCLTSKIRPSLAFHSLSYHAFDAVFLCLFYATFVGSTPGSFLCCEFLQVVRRNGTSSKCTFDAVQVRCVIASAGCAISYTSIYKCFSDTVIFHMDYDHTI